MQCPGMDERRAQAGRQTSVSWIKHEFPQREHSGHYVSASGFQQMRGIPEDSVWLTGGLQQGMRAVGEGRGEWTHRTEHIPWVLITSTPADLFSDWWSSLKILRLLSHLRSSTVHVYSILWEQIVMSKKSSDQVTFTWSTNAVKQIVWEQCHLSFEGNRNIIDSLFFDDFSH